MKLWLTKCHGGKNGDEGRYMLPRLRPVITNIRGTAIADAFEQAGEPIAVKHLCEPGILAALGATLPPLTPRKIELTVRLLDHGETMDDPDSVPTAQGSGSDSQISADNVERRAVAAVIAAKRRGGVRALWLT